MNDWHLISDNVCTNIDILLDLINIREGNISCDGFTGEEINFFFHGKISFIQIEKKNQQKNNYSTYKHIYKHTHTYQPCTQSATLNTIHYAR